jgi:NAD(P)-dependent dehydrogenase (short-subunit alcohol dehydrogenase family)
LCGPRMDRNPNERGIIEGPGDNVQGVGNVSTSSVGGRCVVESEFRPRIPLKKVGIPLEVANQILVFASSTVSSHVTGQVVMVGGGMEGNLLNTKEDLGFK